MSEKKQTPEEYLASGELPETERVVVAELVECRKLHKDLVADMAEAEKDREDLNKEWAELNKELNEREALDKEWTEFDKELNEIDQALPWREDFYQDVL